MDHKRGDRSNSAALAVSPLTALMADQVRGLRVRGVRCSVVASSSDVTRSFLVTELTTTSSSVHPRVLPKWRAVRLTLQLCLRGLLLWLWMRHFVCRAVYSHRSSTQHPLNLAVSYVVSFVVCLTYVAVKSFISFGRDPCVCSTWHTFHGSHSHRYQEHPH